ncbi:MAG TPA: copper amine oxidase N-terminal domain-containing protein, partial [Bacillota bacterium]|nr:copper amine oxidase N-terminal domain-containing protein [Bacillota bacterium]
IILTLGSGYGYTYTYEWKEGSAPAVSATAPSDSPLLNGEWSIIANGIKGKINITDQTGAQFSGTVHIDSGRTEQLANGLGYRLFRSTTQSDIGISVTDFYITSTSYADVNVEPKTTYYYSVKPVLAEARPFEGIDEKLGDVIATFVVTTGDQVYKPGSYKHFIMLKLEDPNMSVDGVSQEVDPGRGTAPEVIAGRTMVPIRAVVEAIGGTVEWDGATKKITLTARGNTVEMWLGKTDIKINGESKKMDIAPVSKNDRTFVPVRFAAENLNCKVDWINSTKEAVIVYEE